MNEIALLANMIYGEAANQPPEVMRMVGSSAINRVRSGRSKEFGATLPEVLQKGYYAVSNPNIPYKQATTRRFPDEKSENAYKQAYAIASSLYRGATEPDEGMFYFTDKEIAKLKKNPRQFDFRKVKEVGKVGGYRVFKY